MTDRITIRKPDDWHLTVRDGAMLKAALPFTARHFGRAIIMPNLLPPVCTVREAQDYRGRILKALPPGSNFEPLMTCYMTHDTKPDEVESGFKAGVFTGVKIYPANVTTNSAAGVSDYRKIRRVIERMEKIGMRLLIHGEVIDPEVDVFDREAVFIERELAPLTRDFPGLKVILEHVSSKVCVDFVRSKAGQAGGTITPYHLMLTRTDWLGWGNRPYMYWAPVIKTAKDRAALRATATSGDSRLFLGTDSAPHPLARKLAVVGAAGVFNSPVAIESYAQVFAEEKALANLEAVTPVNGPRHYGLPTNSETITLERRPWNAPVEMKIDGADERALIHRGGETIPWRAVVDCWIGPASPQRSRGHSSAARR